ncbi:MAG: hypothetical protein HUU56_13380 [Bdellovibrionaceae bacterium]|nr:hypothetical protein [Pseudobdellovibrionaceae bacterium]
MELSNFLDPSAKKINNITTIGLIDIKNLENRFFKDPDFLKEMLSNYVITSNNCLEEMKLAARNQNPSILANSCHKLLGSTLNFSSGYIARYLEDIEFNAREEKKIIVSVEELNKLEETIKMLQDQISELANSWSE